MKIYAVIKNTVYASKSSILFTSHDKALGYILGIIRANNEKLRGIDNDTADWCYNENKLTDSKNWNKFKYIIDDGRTSLHIEPMRVL